jgi:hydroxymethylbilane synthase
MAPPAPARLRLGTRKSPLALAQSGMVARALEAACPGIAVELVPIVTAGDRHRGDLAAIGGKGLFTRELEQGLLDGALDLAVHSLKDLPVELPEGLTVAAFPERADPRDVLISELAASVEALPRGATVLTGSLRRRAQLLLARADLAVEAIRGNVGTRIDTWRRQRAAGLVLARAGLVRMGLEGLPAHPLHPEVMLPAPGQGTLAVEVKAGSPAEPFCRRLDHPPTRRAAVAERRVVAAFGGDCTLPLAAWARPEQGAAAGDDSEPPRLRLDALLATPDGALAARGSATGATPEETAEAVIAALQADGAEEVLARIAAQRAGGG